MDFIQRCLAGGDGFQVRLSKGGASFQPATGFDADLQRFQTVAEEIIAKAGDEYQIFKIHRSSDRPGDLIDRVLITLD
jgi:hypothetical protein